MTKKPIAAHTLKTAAAIHMPSPVMPLPVVSTAARVVSGTRILSSEDVDSMTCVSPGAPPPAAIVLREDARMFSDA